MNRPPSTEIPWIDVPLGACGSVSRISPGHSWFVCLEPAHPDRPGEHYFTTPGEPKTLTAAPPAGGYVLHWRCKLCPGDRVSHPRFWRAHVGAHLRQHDRGATP